jgi:translocation and assembly module TamB
MQASLDKLSGTLRGYPVKANGRLEIAADRYHVDGFTLVSGANQITADGSMHAQTSDLKLVVNAPRLDQLWPGLSGSLSGQGHLKQAWDNPEIQFKASGTNLHYADYQVKHLTINADYDPAANRSSQLKLSAISAGNPAIVIDKLLLIGKGTPKVHQFTADLSSDHGKLAAELNGSLQNKTWRSELTKLNIGSTDFGFW